MAKMDATDQQLLSLLRKDARASVATLAQKLGVSRGTVSNRITKLEDAGIIVGYTVRLRPDSEPNEIQAWMSVAVEGNDRFGPRGSGRTWERARDSPLQQATAISRYWPVY